MQFVPYYLKPEGHLQFGGCNYPEHLRQVKALTHSKQCSTQT